MDVLFVFLLSSLMCLQVTLPQKRTIRVAAKAHKPN